MENRLIQLLKAEGINPTRFAERIGVQRSSMSHILSGRNKPSYDFIVKILESFHAVNPDWLLRGKGLMYKNDIPAQPGLFDSLNPMKKAPIEALKDLSGNDFQDSEGEVKYNTSKGSERGSESKGDLLPGQKIIEKIVVFYSDKTFTDYKPFN